ncbi:MAG: hypothetical protein JWM26_3532 [Betaproteobacteria bacterium]|jgi:hypothetical protein|nr:hypothetical protein [Betaproteobacteria bacterium]
MASRVLLHYGQEPATIRTCLNEQGGMKMRVLVLCCMLAMLCGCTAHYQVQNLAGTAASNRLDRQKSVYITVPEDGGSGSRQSAGSGQAVAQAVASAFSRTAARVHVAERATTKEQAVEAAKKLNAAYVVSPVIAQWEHRATEWSGRPSRVALRISIIDAATGAEITSNSIEGRSRIVSLTPTSPESLLKDPIARYVDGLY